MHYQLIIISHNQLLIKNIKNINEQVKLIDDCHILYKEETISFDYLIFTDNSLVLNKKEIGILTENFIPVTNYEKQTSIENIYYCNEDDVNEILNNL